MRAAAVVAAAVLCLAAGAGAAPFVVTGDRMDLDAERGVLRAWTVRVTDGPRTVVARELVLDRTAGTGVLRGGVQVVGPEGELRSEVARIWFSRGLELLAVEAQGATQLRARGRQLSARRVGLDLRTGVAVADGQPVVLTSRDVKATASRVVYRTRQNHAELAAPARFEVEQGALQGQEASFDLERQTARLAGPVAFRFPSGRGVAGEAVADFAAGRVDLVGPVRMRWRASVLEGQRVVVWYRQGRVVVEGPSRMRVEEEDLPRSP